VLDNDTHEHIPLDVCAVLDCLLDGDFTALELNLSSQTIKAFSSLLAIIAHRSPKLKDLVIRFNKVGLPLETAFTATNQEDETRALFQQQQLSFAFLLFQLGPQLFLFWWTCILSNPEHFE